MWTEKLSNVVLDHGCKRYVVHVCEPYIRTYAHMHAQTKFSIEHTSVGLARQSRNAAIMLLWRTGLVQRAGSLSQADDVHVHVATFTITLNTSVET